MSPKRRNRFAVFRCSYRFRERMPSSNCTFYSVLMLFAAIFFTFPAISRYCLTGKSLHYHWKGIAPPEGEKGDIIHRIAIKERQFLQRSQFDEIQYGPAALKRNAQGTILRPVITAHGHFRVLKTAFLMSRHTSLPMSVFCAARSLRHGRSGFASVSPRCGSLRKR